MTPPAEAELGARIRAARRRRRLSLRALAATIGVSPATLVNLEYGRSPITVTRLTDIATALGTRPEELLAPSPDGPPRPSTAVAGDGHSNAWMPSAGDWRTYEPLALDPVLAAAVDAFVDVGSTGTGLADIARRSGLSVRQVRARHPDVQSLLVVILEITMADLAWRSNAARREAENPIERFRLLIENLALFHTHRRELGFIGASEMRNLERSARRRIAELRIVQQRMVDEETLAGVAAGDFHVESPFEAARAVVTMCTALSSWYDPSGPKRPEEIATRYVELALRVVGHGDRSGTAPGDGR